MNDYNLILDTDSYKASHWKQYPQDAQGYYGYIESRGGKFDATVVVGLQYLLKKYLSKPITQENIDEAAEFFEKHGEPFNLEGWQYILDKYNGYLPVRIKAVPEGTVVPVKNAIMVVESTDDKVFWLPSYLETMIHRNIWYPTTVATVSYEVKKALTKYFDKTGGDKSLIPFTLHDFGARGVSSYESSEIGGMAHLVNFCGSDTVAGVRMSNKYYGCEGGMAAFSVPAAEHSTITSWGRKGESEAYRNMLKQYSKPNGIVSVVSDSYDIYNAIDKIWGQELRQEVVKSGATLVIRPDSGDPVEVVSLCLKLASDRFGFKKNDKGYKVINHVKILQGDGVNLESISDILEAITDLGFCASNMVFGMGGALLQKVDRDLQKFALKCSAIKRDGKWFDVYKDPITDSGKSSKKGRVMLFQENETGNYYTYTKAFNELDKEVLETVFENGNIVKELSLDEVRKNTGTW